MKQRDKNDLIKVQNDEVVFDTLKSEVQKLVANDIELIQIDECVFSSKTYKK